MNREELIAEAADAMFTANDGQLGQGYDEMARAALAVFEQAHTPTDAEAWAAARAVADLRKRETGAPAWFNVDHARAALRAAAEVS